MPVLTTGARNDWTKVSQADLEAMDLLAKDGTVVLQKPDGALYRSADCYVSAGRGEGWDMPLMEAMAASATWTPASDAPSP